MSLISALISCDGGGRFLDDGGGRFLDDGGGRFLDDGGLTPLLFVVLNLLGLGYGGGPV
jgi:hypothetical protein